MELPDTNDVPSRTGEITIETVYSRNKIFRAIIYQKPNNVFRVTKEKWDLSEFEYIGRGFWNPNEPGVTFTDTLDNARKLAREKLAATVDGCEDENPNTSTK